MHAGVLPDLEVREVEAERLDLPDEVLDLAPCGARQAHLDQRALELAQLRNQRCRIRVPAACAARAAGRSNDDATSFAAAARQ